MEDLILNQRTQLETRLLTEKREVYDYFDRLKESAELRTNLAPAVFALGTSLAVRLRLDGQPLFASIVAIVITGLLAIVLATRGRAQYVRSRQVLATAVAINLIKAPRVEAWENAVARIEEQRASGSAEPQGWGPSVYDQSST